MSNISSSDAALINGLVQGSVAAAGNVSVSASNRKGRELAKDLNEKNLAYQREANELNYKRALDALQDERAYNSPSAQMLRYQQAGLNPNLIYQQENTSAGLQLPEYVAPQNDMSLASLTAQSGMDMTNIASIIGDTFSRYQASEQSDMQKQALRIANENALSNLRFQNDTYDARKQMILYNAKKSEYEASNAEYTNSLEYRQTMFEQMLLSIEEKKNSILGSSLSNREKELRLSSLDKQLENGLTIQAQQIASAKLDYMIKNYDVKHLRFKYLREELLDEVIKDVNNYMHRNGRKVNKSTDIPSFLGNLTDYITDTIKEFIFGKR